MDPNVNMTHLELYHHFITSGNFFSLAPLELAAVLKEVTLRYSVKTPYLMHQLLAVSARHMSTESTDRMDFYHYHAIQLQSHALAAFHSHNLGKSTPRPPEQHMPVLCFANMLGTHALYDSLSYLEELASPSNTQHDVLLAFLDKFVDYIRLHRSVNSVVMASWDSYLVSEFRPVVQYCSRISQKRPVGHETDGLKARITALGSLSPETLAACLTAIDGIQISIDAGNDPATSTFSPGILLIWWPLYVPSKFVDALSTGLPDLLSILAYYAVILHRARSLWPVGKSGTQLLRILTAHLGPSYASALAYPRKELGLGLVETVYDAVRGWTERSTPGTRSAHVSPGQHSPTEVGEYPFA